MEKYFEEWNGKKFPVREVMFEVCDNMETSIKVADSDLWREIEAYYLLDDDARAIDNSIFYYCDSGFIASDPTDEEIVEYLTKHGC